MIANRFSKLLRAPEHDAAGLGLGLTLANKIVKIAGGSLDIKSKGLNQGS